MRLSLNDGKQAEHDARKLLEEMDYVVDVARRELKKIPTPFGGTRFVSSAFDFFGCIDIIAKRKDSPTRWVQVTESSGAKKKMIEIQAIPWSLEHDQVEIWKPAGRKGRLNNWRIWRFIPGAKVWKEAVFAESLAGGLTHVTDCGVWMAEENSRFLVRMDKEGIKNGD